MLLFDKPEGEFMKRVIVAVVLLSLSAAAFAQDYTNRARRWDFTLNMTGTDGKSHTFSGGGSARTNTGVGFGFGFDYNADRHWAWGIDFSWASIDYSANIQPGPGNPNPAFNGRGSLDTSRFDFHGIYHLFTGPFTPFVRAGLGTTYVDTNIPAGPPICWAYPWYGTYCGVPTAGAWYFTTNVAAGLRFDFPRGAFVRGQVGRMWTYFDAGTPTTDSFRIEIGFNTN